MITTEHSYTVHLQIPAASDEEARAITKAIFDMLGAGRIVAQYGKPEVRVDAVHLTDADDWAEQVDLVEGLCISCGAPAADRCRDGSGTRKCLLHRRAEYPIRDVSV
jgi:hypothetical protein